MGAITREAKQLFASLGMPVTGTTTDQTVTQTGETRAADAARRAAAMHATNAAACDKATKREANHAAAKQERKSRNAGFKANRQAA